MKLTKVCPLIQWDLLIYLVSAPVVVANMIPGGNKEKGRCERWKVCSENCSNLVPGHVQKGRVHALPVVHKTTVVRSGVHVSPEGREENKAPGDWKWIGSVGRHRSVKRNYSIVIHLHAETKYINYFFLKKKKVYNVAASILLIQLWSLLSLYSIQCLLFLLNFFGTNLSLDLINFSYFLSNL